MLLRSYVALFPLWALVGGMVAYSFPGLLMPIKGAITPLLGVVMLGMGMTLSLGDFEQVVRRPRIVLAGVVMQFSIMPFFAWLVAVALNLPPALATGLILVGCCPGGTASNVIAYLARADVALSVCLTAVSTLLAVVLTPLLATFYIGQRASVPTLELLGSVIKVVLLPVAAGTAINTLYKKRLGPLQRVLPALSVTAIVLIIAIIVALNKPGLSTVAVQVVVAVALHNGLGLLAGYVGGRLLRVDAATLRTLVIEVGMQNSGLGVALAKQYFGALAALPGAVFSVWHNLTGSLLAGRWARHSPNPSE